MTAKTLPRRLFELAATRPDEVALHAKRYGIWHPIRWAEYAAHVRAFAHGLAGLGVARGGVVGIVGDNCPEWLIGELAAHCLGAAVVGLDPAGSDDEVAAVLERAEVGVVIAEDQEQVDKLVRHPDRPRGLAHIIYCDPRGLAHYRDARLARFTDVAGPGRDAARPGWLDGEIAAGDPGDTAFVFAAPELPRLSHADLLERADELHRAAPFAPGERHVALLPLSWIGEQVVSVASGLAHGLALALPEDTATQRADLREIGPDVLLGPPRIWDDLHGEARARIDDAGWLKRRAFAHAYRAGDAIARRRERGEPAGLALAALHRIADALVLGPARDQLGLARVTRGYAGGAPSPEAARFFRAIGVRIELLADSWLVP